MTVAGTVWRSYYDILVVIGNQPIQSFRWEYVLYYIPLLLTLLTTFTGIFCKAFFYLVPYFFPLSIAPTVLLLEHHFKYQIHVLAITIKHKRITFILGVLQFLIHSWLLVSNWWKKEMLGIQDFTLLWLKLCIFWKEKLHILPYINTKLSLQAIKSIIAQNSSWFCSLSFSLSSMTSKSWWPKRYFNKSAFKLTGLHSGMGGQLKHANTSRGAKAGQNTGSRYQAGPGNQEMVQKAGPQEHNMTNRQKGKGWHDPPYSACDWLSVMMSQISLGSLLISSKYTPFVHRRVRKNTLTSQNSEQNQWTRWMLMVIYSMSHITQNRQLIIRPYNKNYLCIEVHENTNTPSRKWDIKLIKKDKNTDLLMNKNTTIRRVLSQGRCFPADRGTDCSVCLLLSSFGVWALSSRAFWGSASF